MARSVLCSVRDDLTEAVALSVKAADSKRIIPVTTLWKCNVVVTALGEKPEATTETPPSGCTRLCTNSHRSNKQLSTTVAVQTLAITSLALGPVLWRLLSRHNPFLGCFPWIHCQCSEPSCFGSPAPANCKESFSFSPYAAKLKGVACPPPETFWCCSVESTPP